MATINGTNGSESLTGTNGDDSIDALAGNDTLNVVWNGAALTTLENATGTHLGDTLGGQGIGLGGGGLGRRRYPSAGPCGSVPGSAREPREPDEPAGADCKRPGQRGGRCRVPNIRKR